MRPEDVPVELVEKALPSVLNEMEVCGACEYGGTNPCAYCRAEAENYARHALAAVLPEIWAEAADFLAHGDENGVGASMVGAARLTMRARAARLTTTTEGTTT